MVVMKGTVVLGVAWCIFGSYMCSFERSCSVVIPQSWKWRKQVSLKWCTCTKICSITLQ